MLTQETLNKLRQMKLNGLVEAYLDQERNNNYEAMSFEDRLGLLVDWEFTKRQHNRLDRLIKAAKFTDSTACIENIDYSPDRHLDRNLILELASCNYIPHARNIVINGATGAGKSYLAQALGISACRHHLPTRYFQLPDLLDELHLAKANEQEQFIKFKHQLAKIPLLIIDEWLLFPITEEETQMLLSIIDRRATTCSTIVVSQFEPAEWLDQIPIPVAAEAITDRIDAQSYHIVIQGKNSMRSKLS